MQLLSSERHLAWQAASLGVNTDRTPTAYGLALGPQSTLCPMTVKVPGSCLARFQRVSLIKPGLLRGPLPSPLPGPLPWLWARTTLVKLTLPGEEE